jgi:hypothetical protein
MQITVPLAGGEGPGIERTNHQPMPIQLAHLAAMLITGINLVKLYTGGCAGQPFHVPRG